MRKVFKLFSFITILGLLSVTNVHAQFFVMENPNVGKPATDFTLDTLTAKNVSFKKYTEGKKAIIFFWATWCPTCGDHIKEIIHNKEEYRKKNIELVLVNEGEKASAVQRYLKKKKVETDIFLDIDTALADPYGIFGLPTFVYVDEEGIIKQVNHSLPGPDEIEKFF